MALGNCTYSSVFSRVSTALSLESLLRTVSQMFQTLKQMQKIKPSPYGGNAATSLSPWAT